RRATRVTELLADNGVANSVLRQLNRSAEFKRRFPWMASTRKAYVTLRSFDSWITILPRCVAKETA
ncbi:hypothetical protein ETH_00003455, partial [Eimeria tenella]